MQAMEQLVISREALDAFARSLHEPAWMRAQRVNAWDAFLSLPGPSFRYGLDIALNAGNLDLHSLSVQPYVHASNPQWEELEACHKGLIIRDLHGALTSHEDLVRAHVFSNLNVSENKLDALHQACWNQGIFVFVPRGMVVSAPIELDFGQINASAFHHVVCVVEEGARVVFSERAVSRPVQESSAEPVPFVRTSWAELNVHAHACVDWFSVQDLNGGAFNFASRRALAGEGAAVNFWSAELGARVARSEVSAVLNGRGASSKNFGVYVARANQQVDLDVASVHAAPETVSNMHTRGIALDRSKAIYRGLVKMHASAVRSNGYQKSDNLLLGVGAEVDAVPYLEIDTSDVKCSHGTSVGHVDEDKLFYLMARGISEEEAIRDMSQGFLAPVLDKAPNAQWVLGVRNRVRELVVV